MRNLDRLNQILKNKDVEYVCEELLPGTISIVGEHNTCTMMITETDMLFNDEDVFRRYLLPAISYLERT